MPGTRWLTFDCYGTIADWNTCMLGALAAGRGRARRRRCSPPTTGRSPSSRPGPHWRPYREVLADGLGLAGAAGRRAVRRRARGAFAEAWPSMPIFPDVAEALSTLASSWLAARDPHQLR